MHTKCEIKFKKIITQKVKHTYTTRKRLVIRKITKLVFQLFAIPITGEILTVRTSTIELFLIIVRQNTRILSLEMIERKPKNPKYM